MTPVRSSINAIYIRITLAILYFNFWPVPDGLDFVHSTNIYWVVLGTYKVLQILYWINQNSLHSGSLHSSTGEEKHVCMWNNGSQLLEDWKV